MTNPLRNRYILALAVMAMVTAPLAAQQPAQAQQAGAQQPVDRYVVGQAVPDVDAGTTLMNLTLEQAIQMALDNNLELKSARMSPQLVDYQIASARAAFNPNFSGNYSYQDAAQANNSTLEGAVARINSKSQSFGGNMSQVLPWHNSNYSVQWSNGRTASTSTTALRNPQYSSGLNFSFGMPLLAGFKIDNNRNNLRTLAITRSIADITLIATIERTKASVRNAYWQLRQSIEAIEIQRRSLALSRQLHQDNLTKVEIGTMASIETLTAETQVVNNEVSLSAAENLFQTRQLALKRLLAASADDPVYRATINPTERPAVAVQEVDIDAAIRRATESRTDVTTTRRNLESQRLSLEITKDVLKPALALTSNLSSNGQGGPQFDRNGVLLVPGGYTQALGSASSFDLPTWRVGLSFTYPLGMVSARANYARAVIQLTQAETQLKAQELDIQQTVMAAGLNVRNAARQLQQQQRAREVNERNADAEVTRFAAGITTNYNVVQAQNNLTSARLSELNAVITYLNALADFDRIQRVP